MEKSPKYNDFLTSVTDSKVFNKWLKDKGFKNTQEYLAEIVRRYKLVGKNYTETDPKTQGEMIASFVGDVLFAEDDSLDRFVSELTEEKKRTFGDLVRDFIDWIKGIFGKTDEVRMLEKKYAELFKGANVEQSVEANKMVEDDTQYSYTSNKNGVDNVDWTQYNLYTATDEFIRDVPYGLRHDFARSLANKTSDMVDGEIRIVYVSGYIFEADGYMHGHIIAPYNEKTKKLLKERRAEYERINENTEIASVWSETVRNAERGSISNIDVSRRGRSSPDDRLFSTSFERNSSRDNERVRSTYETKEEIDTIVQKLKELYGLNEETQYSYTPTKAERIAALVDQYDSGLITREQLEEELVGKKKDDPVSIARNKENLTEEDATTTPDIKRKTGKVTGDGERDTVISKGRADIFSEEFKKEVETDDFIQRYNTITNKETLQLAAEELDREGNEGVQNWLALKPERASVVDIVKGFILLDRYRRLGHIEGQVRVAQKISDMGTAAGQVSKHTEFTLNQEMFTNNTCTILLCIV